MIETFNAISLAGIGAPELVERLKAHNILMLSLDDRRFRAVTHYWVRPEHIIDVLVAIQRLQSPLCPFAGDQPLIPSLAKAARTRDLDQLFPFQELEHPIRHTRER